MELPPDMDLRWVAASDVREETQLGLLSDAERARFHGIRHPRARQHFLLGRVALRLLLADRLAMHPAAVPLVVAPDGSVDVAANLIRVSIAHAGRCAVAVAARRTVGVDLEVIQPRERGVEEFMLHSSEREAYEHLPLDRTRRLILYWTLKEAVLKALRTGLRRSPKRVRLVVNLEYGSGLAIVEGCAPFELRFQQRDGYYVSVAYER